MADVTSARLPTRRLLVEAMARLPELGPIAGPTPSYWFREAARADWLRDAEPAGNVLAATHGLAADERRETSRLAVDLLAYAQDRKRGG